MVFDAELKILYIVTIKSGNIELEPYYGTNTTYTFSGDGTNTIKIKPSNANEQCITINNVAQAANATNAKNDSDGNKISSTYLKLSGGVVNGNLVVSGTSNIDDLQAGSLLISGQSKFLNTINGNLKGNVDGNAKTATSAITATTADKVAKSLKWGSKTYNGSSEQTITAADLGLSGAMHFLGVTTSNVNEGSTLSSIIIDGKSVTQSKGDVVLYSHSEYIWTGSKWEELGSEQSFALKSVEIKAGDGLTGGGTLEATRIISHANTSSQKSITTGGRTYINKIELDDFGHVTSLSTGEESDQTDISGNAGTATKAYQDWDGNEITKSYTRQKYITGIYNDYTNFVILLCSLDNSELEADFYCQGTFFLKRANTESECIQRIEVNVGKKYNSSNPVFASFRTTSNYNSPKLIRCTYNGIKYAGLYFYIKDNSYNGSSNIFIGKASNLDNVRAINIYNNHTKTVLNSEIYNSIEYIKNNILGTTLYGTPYITYDGGENFHEIISKYNISEQSVKEAVTASKAINDSSGNNIASTYITNVSTSGQNLVVTKNGNNTTTPINIWESNLQWGGKDINSGCSPIDAAMIPELGANRFAFLNPEGITLEYSKDGGNTWTEETDITIKRTLFGSGKSRFFIGQRNGGKTATKDWMCRVIINTDKAQIYTILNKVAIHVSANGSSGCYCTFEAATSGFPTTFKILKNKTRLTGCDDWNVLNGFRIITYGYEDFHYKYLRFTFGITTPSASYNNLQIMHILAFGGAGWTIPSNMAKNGHLYSFDENQNATFPATVTAAQLKGNLDWSYIQNAPEYKLTAEKISTAWESNKIRANGVLSLGTKDVYTLIGITNDVSGIATTGTIQVGTNVNLAANNAETMISSTGVFTQGSMKSKNGFFQTSDIRKKNFLSDIEIDFDALKNLPKKYFEWKDNPDIGKQIGTSAQAILKLYPELVNKDENGYYSIDYARLSIIALAAIDKLNEKIESLKRIINSK